MVSANETGGQKDEVDIQPLEYGGMGNDEEILSIRDGLYILTNKMSRTTLDLYSRDSGTQCHGWPRHSLGNQIWIVRKCPTKDTFTLRNTEQAGFLDVLAGNSENGAPAVGHHRVEGSLNQEWQIVEQTPGYYTCE
ncbi:carbohydrate-binding module family 13 protein [Tulasnella calospora MUT 4182]|uniref:Carbohydrate-binding module family 13 protein n=1 Tax=Tulasnella calospora MUT 4182 TaxID=1051891 RepID=A0A0C3KZ86_9AGAM|nr:carbohydrate-binding module family 13 protein [Tulasnella calospora MUT 4182]